MPHITVLDVDNWFEYHTPTSEALPKFKEIREAGKNLALVIMDNCPECPDTTVAIRKVREAVMTANAAIACLECPISKT
jgi:hypothetical protein